MSTVKELFSQILPPAAILDSPQDLLNYGRDWLKDYKPNASLILLPHTVNEVCEIVKICAKNKIAVVPSGGRTGLSGGATALNGEVIISLEKLNKVLEVNKYDRTVTCQAGTVTQKLQEVALENNLYFPVDFASKGSSQIGGNLATNAGGIRVIRYGNIKDWVVGLKIVNAKGELIDINGHLFKNQTGYDLKSLIIGSEGTLAIIVEATLKLINTPSELIRVICAVSDLQVMLDFLAMTRERFNSISAFEYFSRESLECVLKHNNLKDPFLEKHPHYVLIEFEKQNSSIRDEIEEFLGSHLETGFISDAVISQSKEQCDQFMSYRELISETISSHYVPHKNDISVPIPSIPEFLQKLYPVINAEYPAFRVLIFGHLGDGNLHLNFLKPDEMENAEFFLFCKEADKRIFALIQELKGSISAEHGVGLLKRDFLSYSRTSQEIELMRAIKKVFDPDNILNPGKIFA